MSRLPESEAERRAMIHLSRRSAVGWTDRWGIKLAVAVLFAASSVYALWEVSQRGGADRASLADRRELHQKLDDQSQKLNNLELSSRIREDQGRQIINSLSEVRADTSWIRRQLGQRGKRRQR